MKRWILTAMPRKTLTESEADFYAVLASQFNGDYARRTFFTKQGARRVARDHGLVMPGMKFTLQRIPKTTRKDMVSE
jgi:hypothetical protein